MKSTWYSLALLIGLLFRANATPQQADRLFVDGKCKNVYTMSFEEGIMEKLNSIKKPEMSSNWRGYTVDLELKKRMLWVKAVWIPTIDENGDVSKHAVSLRELFGKKAVKANWFSGEIVHYYGKRIGYTHAKEKVEVYYFKSGVLINTRKMSYKEYSDREDGVPVPPKNSTGTKNDGSEATEKDEG